MRISQTELPGVLILEPRIHGDTRGLFLELWNRDRYRDAGIDCDFVQSNLSRSNRGTVRGLHYQEPNPQGKLVMVVSGSVCDVAVDIRVGSPTFGHWTARQLDARDRRQMWIPPGFAHGFCALTDATDVVYMATAPYDPAHEHAIRYDDPGIGVAWPSLRFNLSPRDLAAPRLDDADVLPTYEPPPQDRR